jgi:hypothetical protein
MFLNMIISFKGKVGISKDKNILKYDNSTKGWAWKEWPPGTCCFMERTGAWDLLGQGTCYFMERAGPQDLLFHGKGGRAGHVVSLKGLVHKTSWQCCRSGSGNRTGSGRIRNFWPDPDPIRNRNKRFGYGFESGSETGFESGAEINL